MPDSPTDTTVLLPTEQVAQLLGIHAKTLRELAQARQVRHYRVGRSIRWRVDELLEDLAVPTTP